METRVTRRQVIAGAAGLALAGPAAAATPLSELLERSRLGPVTGFVLADAASGAVIEAHQGGLARPPASTAKILTALYALDDVAVYFMHMGNDDMEAQQLGLSIQQHFPIPNWEVPLVPYLGAATGYGWLDIDGPNAAGADTDKGGWVARLEAGAIFRLTECFALHAGARLNFSTHGVFLEDDGGTEDTQWNFAVGARYYY